jgi:hypothetical protein
MKTVLRISIIFSLWFLGISANAAEEPASPVNLNERESNPVMDAYTGDPKRTAGKVSSPGDPDPACCATNMSPAAIGASTNDASSAGQAPSAVPAGGADGSRPR